LSTVGGDQGKLLEKILQFTPDITGTVFDTASTIERAKQGIGNDACIRRCSYVIGDFFTRFHKEQTPTFYVA
jgi:hypothetical protein